MPARAACSPSTDRIAICPSSPGGTRNDRCSAQTSAATRRSPSRYSTRSAPVVSFLSSPSVVRSPLGIATVKSRMPREPLALARTAKREPSIDRPVTDAVPTRRLEPWMRPSRRRAPTASRVCTSMTPPGPPVPSMGDDGDADTRICTMSVTGIELRSKLP